MDKPKLTVLIDLDTCADFYDFCIENDIEFIVNGFDFTDTAADQAAILAKAQKEMTKLVTLLLFKRKLRDLLKIITRKDDIKVSLPEAKELLKDFFTELSQQSSDLLTSLIPNLTTPTTPSGNTNES